MVTINQAAACEPKLEVQTTAAAPTEPGTKGWSVHIFIDTLHNEVTETFPLNAVF